MMTSTEKRSSWAKQYGCQDLSPLIICRGPIRKEVMDEFDRMGLKHYGILLSEKDSVLHPQALAPELRGFNHPERVHLVPDYTGTNKAERTERIAQIIQIAKDEGYDSIFAGYGFMAEEESLVLAIEQSGLTFIGPCSRTVRQAGQKDEAKRTALECGVSVTPGIDDLTQRALLRKYPSKEALVNCAQVFELQVDKSLDESALAEDLLIQSYTKGVDIIDVEDVAEEARVRVGEFWQSFASNRIRLKAIGGGGGKGQRILPAPGSYEGDEQSRLASACALAPEYVREILQEVKANGVGDNKNILIELNIETTRHQEIQVIGNGDWCMTLGARDCSLQMHEQKLVEISQTQEELSSAIKALASEDKPEQTQALEKDLSILKQMELEAAKFGQAVGLDSVSTFECIVDKDQHFFMEMNTRIQVEHRVTELVYRLRFINPDDETDYFDVESLVELMCLLAKHKQALPKPKLMPRHAASVEIRLNAMNEALNPHAGGQIQYWSNPIEGEVRDEQGICVRNPSTQQFVPYTLVGAYDSNIALLLSSGDSRADAFKQMAEILRKTLIKGHNLKTNLNFHYGIVHWFLSENVRAQCTTQFVMPYLTLVGRLNEAASGFDLVHAYSLLKKTYLSDDSLSNEEQANLNQVFNKKQTLILRPLGLLFKDPHLLSAWLSFNKTSVECREGQVVWLENPLVVLSKTYHLLNMSFTEALPASEVIWQHDEQILSDGLAFYDTLFESLNEQVKDYRSLDKIIQEANPKESYQSTSWQNIKDAHTGFQLGLELMGALVLLANEVGFYDFGLNSDLTPKIPSAFQDKSLQIKMSKVLAPPPATSADELVAVSGGMYYGQEAPDRPPFIKEGDRFEKGQPLYIIEVMKMFNKVCAPFSGRVDKILVENSLGEIVQQGQPLFKVTPDEILEVLDPEKQRKRVLSAIASIIFR